MGSMIRRRVAFLATGARGEESFDVDAPRVAERGAIVIRSHTRSASGPEMRRIAIAVFARPVAGAKMVGTRYAVE